jgi:fructose transport system substrate-binding protein
MRKDPRFLTSSALTVIAMLCASSAMAQQVTVGLITKTNTNPFFVKMKEGAEAKAKELGVKLSSFAGKVDGDN